MQFIQFLYTQNMERSACAIIDNLPILLLLIYNGFLFDFVKFLP